MTNATSHGSRPTVRPGLRRAAIVLSCVLLPLAGHALWDHIEVRRLVKEVEQIRAKGEPVTEREAGDNYAGTTSEHRRASRQYLAAAMLVLHVRNRPEFVELREWLYGQVPLESSLADISSRLKAVVDDAREALILADEANALEFRGFEPGTEYSYRMSGLTSLTHVISARTVSLVLASQPDRAVESALASLKARRAAHGRWLSLMNPADHQIPIVLSLSSPGPGALQRLQAALEAADASHDPAREIERERARLIEMIWRQYYGPDP
ncbi:MAG: hypothetical protein ACRD15_13745, partial [Vicinamibacterales bacterium]